MQANLDFGGFRGLNLAAPATGTDAVTRDFSSNAANLTSGTIPDGRLSSNVALYNASMASFSVGTLPDARLSSNVPLKNTANTFTAAQTVTVADDVLNAILNGATQRLRFGGYQSGVAASYIDAVAVASGNPAPLYLQGSTIALVGSGLSFTGALTTPNTSASECGFKGMPQNNQNGNYTLVLADAGRTIYKNAGGAGETFTIPANASVAFAVGTVVKFINNGGGALTIAITSDTLVLAGVGTTGSRTLADQGIACIEKVNSTAWYIYGIGVS